jgi:hypothetical protein
VADYDAKIRVSADTKQAESELSKLQKRITQLGEAAFKLDARNFQKSVRDIGTAVQGIGQRGALGALTLAAGKATTALGGLGTKFGILGAAAASAGATVNSALGGVPAVITDILNHIGQVPNAFGIAAVAAMAFAPQILKASSAATGLATAVDKAVGAQTTQKIAQVIDNIGQLNTELNATASTFKDLISGSTLNQLNNQLRDAVQQSGEFHSSTAEAVVAAEQLVAVQKEQRKEQKAINDLIRQAQGLQPQDVRDAELNRRVALLKSREIQQQKDLKLQTQINAELAEYERLAAQVAAQTKLWASNLERITRSSKAGVFGTQSQLRTRVQEFQENRRSAEVARERSAELMARERAMAGGQYSLAQVPARGELFPGGRTETASDQYRSMLNEQARIRAAASDALARSERTVIGLQAQTLKTEQQITAAKRQQQSVDERSIQILRDQNKLLMEQYRAQQRVASGTLDPASLRADRQRRVEQGRAAQARRREMTENVIIGGAFPMLFGGGVGTVAGGALGGLIPGNPMLSVATSAVGALVDQFVASVTEAGSAMRDPITNFQKLADAGLIASRSQKQYIERLIEAGRVTEAATVIQDELIKKIGVEGLRDLQNAGAASDKLNKAFAEFSLQAQAAIAGPLAGILSWLANVIAIGNRATREAVNQTDILQGLSAQDQAALQREEQRILQGANLFNEAQKRQQVSQLYQSYAGRATMQRPSTSIDKTPELQAQAQTRELAAQVQLEGQKLTLAGMSLEKDGQSYVAVAKQVAQQEYKNKLLEIQNYWIGKAYDATKNQLMIQQANLKYAAEVRNIDQQAARAAEQTNQDRIRAYQLMLQLQNQLAQTVLDEYAILEKGVDLYKGPIAGYEQSLILLERRQGIQEGIIRNEYASAQASEDYATNQKTIDATFDNRLNNLKLEYQYLKENLNVQRERAKLEQALAAQQLLSQNAQRRVAGQTEIDRLQTQLEFPFGGEQLQRDMQMLDQYMRRLDELIPLQEEIKAAQLTVQRAQETPGLLTADQLSQKQAELAVQQDQLAQLETELQLRDQLEQQLLRQQQIYEKYGFIVNEVSQAFSDSITGIITGTTTVAEAFSRMFENIGKAFIDMATQMLAQQLFMTVLRAFAGGGSSSIVQGTNVPISAMPAGMAFAEGGFVTGPTRALIGEGGEPEYVIPQSKMSAAMSRYSRGARGESVIPGSGSSGESGGTATATMAPIDVRYSVERINNVDYVTADQFQRGMAQAAQQGAAQGETRALRKLQMSSSTRRRVGI